MQTGLLSMADIAINKPKPPPSMRGSGITTQYQSSYLARMNERQASKQASNNSVGSLQYESSYMKKVTNNPSPSVSRGSSITSRKEKEKENKPNILSPILSDRSRVPRRDSNKQPMKQESRHSSTEPLSLGSKVGNKAIQPVLTAESIKMQLRGVPTIRTNSQSSYGMEKIHTPRVVEPPSPAQTIDAILCEENNVNSTSYDSSLKRSQSPFSFSGTNGHPQRRSPSPIQKLNHSRRGRSPARTPSPARNKASPIPPRNRASPSPERVSSYTRRSMQSYSEENTRNHFNSMSMNDNSSGKSMRSGRSYSISPNRYGRNRSSSYRNSIPRENSMERSMSRKNLSHQFRYEPSKPPRRYQEPPASYTAPFWTQVSVKVSSALLKAGKDRKFAEIAQIAIVQAGEDQYEQDQSALNFVASKASLAVIEAGGDANTAAIATVACLKANDDTPSTEEQIKQEIEKTMTAVKDKASAVAETTYDGGAKAVNVISTLATKGYEDLKTFSEISFRKYQVYQRNYVKDRQNYLLERRLARAKKSRKGRWRSYRDTRDDDTLSDDDRYRRRRGTPKSSRKSHRYDSDDSSDYSSRRRSSSRSRRKSRKHKSRTYDSRSFDSSTSSSYSSRTGGSSVSSSESGSSKDRKSSRTSASKSSSRSGKDRQGRFSKSFSSTSR